MEAVGIIRELDNLGRVVIPKEWRDLYKFEGPLEIVATAEGVSPPAANSMQPCG